MSEATETTCEEWLALSRAERRVLSARLAAQSASFRDMETTLRAQLDAARLMCERFDSALRTKEGENAELRAEMAGLTERRDDLFAAPKATTGDVVRLTATLAERDGEIARLEGREREAEVIMANDRDSRYSYDYRDESRAAWLAGCKS